MRKIVAYFYDDTEDWQIDSALEALDQSEGFYGAEIVEDDE